MMMELSATRGVSDYGFGDTARDVQSRVAHAHERLAMVRGAHVIQKVAARAENWDGCGSAKPDAGACLRAAAELNSFIETAFAQSLGWQDPHIGSNEIGEISFEWWRGPKRLTIYVAAEEMHYVCSWGADINDHMDAGVFDPQDFVRKWRWFRV